MDILKSGTAGIWIPEIDLDLGEWGLDGLYITVEGLINNMKDNLKKSNHLYQRDALTNHNIGVNDKVNDNKTRGGGDPNISDNPSLRQ